MKKFVTSTLVDDFKSLGFTDPKPVSKPQPGTFEWYDGIAKMLIETRVHPNTDGETEITRIVNSYTSSERIDNTQLDPQKLMEAVIRVGKKTRLFRR